MIGARPPILNKPRPQEKRLFVLLNTVPDAYQTIPMDFLPGTFLSKLPIKIGECWGHSSVAQSFLGKQKVMSSISGSKILYIYIYM